mmetsp:Transcript_36962/g.42162  ORF Transcript_36962/g.42162 Transcript_36962/m.42162 type:complete len:174 (+) Transcript_36962:40-561(+)
MKLNHVRTLFFVLSFYFNIQASYGCDFDLYKFYNNTGLAEAVLNISSPSASRFCPKEDDICKITYGDASDYTATCEANGGYIYTGSVGFGCKIGTHFSATGKYFVEEMPVCLPKSCEPESNAAKQESFGNVVDSLYRDFAQNRCEVQYYSAATKMVVAATSVFVMIALLFVTS